MAPGLAAQMPTGIMRDCASVTPNPPLWASQRQQEHPCSVTLHIAVEWPEQMKIQALDFPAVPKTFAAEGGEERGEEREPEQVC